MKKVIIKSILLVISIVCILCCKISAVYADSDGTEMQVMQPEQLEIQLGANWAGVEFQLKTDVGLYPGVITVGEDGILRLEIGGSSYYMLSCAESSVAIPAPEPESVPVTAAYENADSFSEIEPSNNPDSPVDSAFDGAENSESTEEPKSPTLAGIPILHIALFGGGLLLAAASLVVIRSVEKKRRAEAEQDDED